MYLIGRKSSGKLVPSVEFVINNFVGAYHALFLAVMAGSMLTLQSTFLLLAIDTTLNLLTCGQVNIFITLFSLQISHTTFLTYSWIWFV